MDENREFDHMLSQDLSQLTPPDDVLKKVNPWSAAFYKILWGIGLTHIIVPIPVFWVPPSFYLLGTLMLLAGFCSLRRENRWFRLCWYLSLWRTAGATAALLLTAAGIPLSGRLTLVLELLIAFLPFIAQYIGLAYAVLTVYRKAGQFPPTAAPLQLPIFCLLLLLTGILQLGYQYVIPPASLCSDLVFLLVLFAELGMLAFLFRLMEGLWKTAQGLDCIGYAITPVSSPWPVKWLILIYLLVAVLCAGICHALFAPLF